MIHSAYLRSITLVRATLLLVGRISLTHLVINAISAACRQAGFRLVRQRSLKGAASPQVHIIHMVRIHTSENPGWINCGTFLCPGKTQSLKIGIGSGRAQEIPDSYIATWAQRLCPCSLSAHFRGHEEANQAWMCERACKSKPTFIYYSSGLYGSDPKTEALYSELRK